MKIMCTSCRISLHLLAVQISPNTFRKTDLYLLNTWSAANALDNFTFLKKLVVNYYYAIIISLTT